MQMAHNQTYVSPPGWPLDQQTLDAGVQGLERWFPLCPFTGQAVARKGKWLAELMELAASGQRQPLSLLLLAPHFSSLGSLILRWPAGERAPHGLMRPGISTEGAACLLAAALEA